MKSRIERGDPYSIPKVYDIEVGILEVVRGKQVWERVDGEGLAEAPTSGLEYVLVRVSFSYSAKRRGVIEEEPFQLLEGHFCVFPTDGGSRYELPQVLKQPQPQLLGRIVYPSDIHEGWILLEVPDGAQEPLLAFNRGNSEAIYGVFGSLWFQL